MITALGLPLLARLDQGLTTLHRYVRRWRAVLDGDDWTQVETAGCHTEPACGRTA